MFHEPAVWRHGHIGPAHLERAGLVAAVRQRNRSAALITVKHDERRMDEQDSAGLRQRGNQRQDRQQQQDRSLDIHDVPQREIESGVI